MVDVACFTAGPAAPDVTMMSTLSSNELGCDPGKSFTASLGRAIFNRDSALLNPAELAQSLYKRIGPRLPTGPRTGTQEAYCRQLRHRLRPCREPAKPPHLHRAA